MRLDVILKREQEGVLRQCGYLQKGDDIVSVVIIDGVTIPCDNITEARSKFWEGVERPSYK